MKNSLIILGRYPSSENVKTRLASEIGQEKAAKLYRQWAENIFREALKLEEMNYSAVNCEVSLRASSSVNHSSPQQVFDPETQTRRAARCSGSRIDIYFYYADVKDKAKVIDWVKSIAGEKIICVDPVSSDVEKNLLYAFKKSLSDGGKVVSVATDLPNLKSTDIINAFQGLDNFDVVLGPDQRGGFSLFGVRNKLYSEVFEYKYRDRNNMFNEEVERIKKLNLRFKILPVITDVDIAEDLKN